MNKKKKKINVVNIEDIDFEYIGIAYFIHYKDVELFYKQLNSELNFVVIEHYNVVYEVGLRYKTRIDFA